ncbi:hypothetical protein T440DRAFT_87536 [Plenodomus tracheiphilus IPT5]|uniref:Uncharacterized protein n=1 Tax=Plenodomus tracheiphilus IPT5 TaxID=1408161 RepID=A0A6A7B7Q2_9PLEO|nr:hypothetical protein T440DRAFT_87536 [Plenodomus tracheiphilus IPT5]
MIEQSAAEAICSSRWCRRVRDGRREAGTVHTYCHYGVHSTARRAINRTDFQGFPVTSATGPGTVAAVGQQLSRPRSCNTSSPLTKLPLALRLRLRHQPTSHLCLDVYLCARPHCCRHCCRCTSQSLASAGRDETRAACGANQARPTPNSQPGQPSSPAAAPCCGLFTTADILILCPAGRPPSSPSLVTFLFSCARCPPLRALAPRPSPLAPRPSPLAPRPSPLAPRPSPLAPRPSPLAPPSFARAPACAP